MNTEWTEIIVTVPCKEIDKAGNIANMTVPYGIYIEDYSNLEEDVRNIAKIDLIDEGLLAMDRNFGKVHIYISPEENPSEAIAFLKERYKAENIPFEIECQGCNPNEWLENWKKYFKPIKIGKKLLIRPVWENDYDAGNRKVINLEPGLAFGTGTHETTRLCLEALENYIKDGCTMLDVGCGSGILSAAGLLLGAKFAVGVDIDELAVKASIENAQRNNVEDRYTAVHGNLTDKVQGTFDIITANIVADAIIVLSDSISNFMNDDSIYIMSGIIDTRLQDVLIALENKFNIISQREEKGWICLAAKKK